LLVVPRAGRRGAIRYPFIVSSWPDYSDCVEIQPAGQTKNRDSYKMLLMPSAASEEGSVYATSGGRHTGMSYAQPELKWRLAGAEACYPASRLPCGIYLPELDRHG
jgi:hypothetical protein